MDEDSNLLPIQMIDGEADTRISVISSTDPNAVLGESVPDVPGKFDLVPLIDYSVDESVAE